MTCAHPLEHLHERGISLLQRAAGEVPLSSACFDELRAFVRELVMDVAQQPEMALDWATNTPSVKKPFLLDHSFNVALFAVIFGLDAIDSDQELFDFVLTSLIHDLGMFDLPQRLLDHAGELGEDERHQLHKHPWWTVQRLAHLDEIPPELLKTIQDEHERADGSGYPERKKSPQIRPHAQALQMLDLYEALIHPRPYRLHAMTPHEAMRHLIQLAREGRLENRIVRQWLNRLSFYPIGSFVRLNNGSVGKVLASHLRYPLQPLVVLFQDPQGRPLDPPQVVDLLEQPHFHIAEDLPPPEP